MLSIIIMTRNEEKLIGRMLESIVHQEYDKEFEVLVVDAHSTDRTREIVWSYADRLDIRIINGVGKGIGVDRNLGGMLSRGNLYFFTEGDCYLSQGLLQKIDHLFVDPRLVAWSSIALPNRSPVHVQFTYWLYDVIRYLFSRIPFPLKKFSTSGAILVIRPELFVHLKGFKMGGDMNDDGELGKQICIHCEHSNDKFIFNINKKTVIYRSMGRFEKGFIQAMNHYIYVLVNFVPRLEPLLKTQMKVEGKRFQHEKD